MPCGASGREWSRTALGVSWKLAVGAIIALAPGLRRLTIVNKAWRNVWRKLIVQVCWRALVHGFVSRSPRLAPVAV